jgi:hypothetical protein
MPLNRCDCASCTDQYHGRRIYWHQPGPSWFEDSIAYCYLPPREHIYLPFESHNITSVGFRSDRKLVMPVDDGVSRTSFCDANGHQARKTRIESSQKDVMVARDHATYHRHIPLTDLPDDRTGRVLARSGQL